MVSITVLTFLLRSFSSAEVCVPSEKEHEKWWLNEGYERMDWTFFDWVKQALS